MPIGHYGSVVIVPAGTIPTINISRELVVALETASNRHFPMLLVLSMIAALNELSHAPRTFIFGNKSPPCLASGMGRTESRERVAFGSQYLASLHRCLFQAG
jgi:hypothetical protein